MTHETLFIVARTAGLKSNLTHALTTERWITHEVKFISLEKHWSQLIMTKAHRAWASPSYVISTTSWDYCEEQAFLKAPVHLCGWLSQTVCLKWLQSCKSETSSWGIPCWLLAAGWELREPGVLQGSLSQGLCVLPSSMELESRMNWNKPLQTLRTS